MKAIEAYPGLAVQKNGVKYIIQLVGVKNQNTYAIAIGPRGIPEEIFVQVCTRLEKQAVGEPTGQALLKHIHNCYGTGPYAGATAKTIRDYIRLRGAACGVKWVSATRTIKVICCV